MIKIYPLAVLFFALIAPLVAADRLPNIVLIFADDLGYADLGAQGSTEVVTPRIDSIATNGMRFTDGYVTASMCSPSRAGIVSGRYQQRFGFDVNQGLEFTMKRKFGLPPDQPTLAEILEPAGYTSAVIGKWDLGSADNYHPNQRGFDYFYGFVGGSRFHPPTKDHGKLFFNKMMRNTEYVEETDWSSDIYGKESADFIRREAGKPFFLYASFTAPHWPMEAKAADMAKFADVENLHRRTFLAMMSGLDRGVGMILDAIKESGIEEQTLVFFLSDNGGATTARPNTPIGHGGFPAGVNTSKNDPLRGRKGDLYDGGIRIPFFAAWPGVIPAGTVSNVPVISLDVGATAAALAGVDVTPDRELDGVNLMPILNGEETALSARNLYWRIKKQTAIRSGDWKYLKLGNKPAELYNLAKDISEQNNRIKTNPEKAEELSQALNAWLDTLAEPAW